MSNKSETKSQTNGTFPFLSPEQKKIICDELINGLEQHREQLYTDPKISGTKFSHMQTAIHWDKQIIRAFLDQPTEKGAIAWVK